MPRYGGRLTHQTARPPQQHQRDEQANQDHLKGGSACLFGLGNDTAQQAA